MPKTETLNLRISPELKRKIIELAEADKRSIANYIETVIDEKWTEHVKHQEGKPK